MIREEPLDLKRKSKNLRRRMGKAIETVIRTTKEVAKETVKLGSRIVIGAASGVRYMFGKPFPGPK